MKKVEHLKDLPREEGHFIALFIGKDYADAVLNAQKMLSGITHYYEQPKFAKSLTILVSYKKKENKDDNLAID